MTNNPLFAGYQAKARQPTPGERVWAMTKGGEEAHAELRDQGVAGVELQLFRGDDFANGRALSLTRGGSRGFGTTTRADGRDGVAGRLGSLPGTFAMRPRPFRSV